MSSVGLTQANLTELKLQAPFLHNLLRYQPSDFQALLYEVETHSSVENTETSAHCYFLALDGNGRPRVRDLIRTIANNVVDYSIPRSKVKAAIAEAHIRNLVEPLARLNKEALALFNHLKKTGEGGEILLSLLAEAFLKLPQVLAKMSLKTNPAVHYHGSDGIHATVDESTGKLAIYWGESKLYKNVNTAITKCFESLSPFLLGSGGIHARQERDLQLLRDGIDLADNDLESAFRRFLDPDDVNFNKLEHRGLCLVGFDNDDYPKGPNEKEADALKSEIKSSLSAWKDKIKEKVTEEKINPFVIEIFCVPFPSVEKFRSEFLEEIGV